MKLLLVFLGSGIGGVLRYSISILFPYSGKGFPTNTFLANLLSCLFLGFLVFFFIKNENHNLKLFLAFGLCGGFSTFSTFSKEIFQLYQNQQILMALAYVGLSLIIGVFMILLGYIIGKTLIT